MFDIFRTLAVLVPHALIAVSYDVAPSNILDMSVTLDTFQEVTDELKEVAPLNALDKLVTDEGIPLLGTEVQLTQSCINPSRLVTPADAPLYPNPQSFSLVIEIEVKYEGLVQVPPNLPMYPVFTERYITAVYVLPVLFVKVRLEDVIVVPLPIDGAVELVSDVSGHVIALSFTDDDNPDAFDKGTFTLVLFGMFV
jgi:hypothetical protein